MTTELTSAIEQLLAGRNLAAEQMQTAVSAMMDGLATQVQIAAFLTALRCKGEVVSELVGAARAMRERALPITTNKTDLLDTCGTGGDGLKTFNISTATAFVAAAAGVVVAKHGNRSVTSSSGSADVLEALGVQINLTPEQVGRCIAEIGIGFCYAPLIHGAMKYAAPVRKQLGFRTVFNFLGPLTNPAKASYQLVGANKPQTARMLAEALAQLQIEHAIVVCGAGQLDEVSLWGETLVLMVADGTVEESAWSAESFGLPACEVHQLTVESAAESAAVIQSIFSGESGPARDMVVANSAAALLAARKTENLTDAVQLAQDAIDAGHARQCCQRLAEWTLQQS